MSILQNALSYCIMKIALNLISSNNYVLFSIQFPQYLIIYKMSRLNELRNCLNTQ